MQIDNLKQHRQHLTTLAAWHHQQWQTLNPGNTLQQRIDTMQAYLNDQFIPTTFIALQGNELLGSAAIIENDMDTKPELTPWLASVFVAEPFRNKGIGSQLVRHTTEQAQQAGIKQLYLFTPDRQSFYQQLGWQVFSVEGYRQQQVTVMVYPC